MALNATNQLESFAQICSAFGWERGRVSDCAVEVAHGPLIVSVTIDSRTYEVSGFFEFSSPLCFECYYDEILTVLHGNQAPARFAASTMALEAILKDLAEFLFKNESLLIGVDQTGFDALKIKITENRRQTTNYYKTAHLRDLAESAWARREWGHVVKYYGLMHHYLTDVEVRRVMIARKKMHSV